MEMIFHDGTIPSFFFCASLAATAASSRALISARDSSLILSSYKDSRPLLGGGAAMLVAARIGNLAYVSLQQDLSRMSKRSRTSKSGKGVAQ